MMEKDRIIKMFQDETSSTATLTGFYAACAVNGIAVPYDPFSQPNEARVWAMARVIQHFDSQSHQLAGDVETVARALNSRPAWLEAVGAEDADMKVVDNSTLPSHQSAPSTTQHPVLLQIMELYRTDASALEELGQVALRQLAEVLLLADHDLRETPFWNEIDSFVDSDGKPIPRYSEAYHSVDEDPSPSVTLKCNYLRKYVIPECLQLMTAHLEGLALGPTIDDAILLRRLLSVLPE